MILQALSKHKLLIPLCSSNPTKNDQNTQFKAPITTTPNDHHHNQSPSRYPLSPTNTHTHTWVRVKPVCEAVYTASLCFTVCFTVLTVLNYNNSPYPQYATNPVTMRFPTSPTSSPNTTSPTYIPHINTPTYTPININPTYTHQNTPHEYHTRNTLVFHLHMHLYSTHMCATYTPHPYVGSGKTR